MILKVAFFISTTVPVFDFQKTVKEAARLTRLHKILAVKDITSAIVADGGPSLDAYRSICTRLDTLESLLKTQAKIRAKAKIAADKAAAKAAEAVKDVASSCDDASSTPGDEVASSTAGDEGAKAAMAAVAMIWCSTRAMTAVTVIIPVRRKMEAMLR
jgi:hypothetical protein